MASESILVVDPDRGIRDLMTVLFTEEGYVVTTAQSLREALRLLSNSNFDLIVTEALGKSRMFFIDPGFISELRSVGGDVPIILVSIYAYEDWPRPVDFGLAAVVPKPFEIDQLLRIVGRALRKPGANSKAKRAKGAGGAKGPSSGS